MLRLLEVGRNNEELTAQHTVVAILKRSHDNKRGSLIPLHDEKWLRMQHRASNYKKNDMKLIQHLNLKAYIEGEQNSDLDVAMFWSSDNICEMSNPENDCITMNGLYFGTPDKHETKFCPKHFFSAEDGYKLYTEASNPF